MIKKPSLEMVIITKEGKRASDGPQMGGPERQKGTKGEAETERVVECLSFRGS